MKFYIIFILGVIAFLFLPFGIDQFFMNKFITNWDMGQWAGFLGSYLGGAIGGVIAIWGIWWQMTRDDKKRKKEKAIGVLKGVLYSLDKNLKTKEHIRIFCVLDCYYDKITCSKFYSNCIYEIFPEIIKENYKIIFELDIGKEIIDLYELIKEFNQNYNFLILESSKKRNILETIIETYKSGHNGLEESTSKEILDLIKDIKETSKRLSFSNELLKLSEKEVLDLGKKIHSDIDSLTLNLHLSNSAIKLENEINFLEQYLLSESIIISDDSNIFTILNKMKNLKSKIEEEIQKLENQ